MREYETVFITQPEITDTDRGQLGEKIGALIAKHEGRLFFSKDLGRKNLAYKIKKLTKGIYTCLDYAAGGKAVSELERMMGMNENVIRFLTIVKNENVDVEARAAEIIARGEDAPLAVAEEVEKKEVKEESAVVEVVKNSEET